MKKYPYILLQSPPIGPLALRALELADYPPLAILDDPRMDPAEMLERIEAAKPTFLLVVGFGAILKRPILDSVAGQVINIHPSYLPEYRGPAPVVQTILDGTLESGVSVMEIDTKMDHGPILAQERYALRGDEYPEELYQVLIRRGIELFLATIDDYLEEKLEPLPQNHAEATITHFIKKEQGHLDLRLPAAVLERQIRAFHGWPRSWIIYNTKRLIIEKAHTHGDTLRIELVQPENGKVMTLEAFCAGQRITTEQFYQQLDSQRN